MTEAIGNLSAAAPSAAVAVPAAPAPAPSPPDSSAASAAAPSREPAAPDLQAAVAALNQHAQERQTSLHFQVDKITGQMVVSVIDTQNNQLLLQIPSQSALAVAQGLELEQLHLMNKTA
jgi:flagellar protein FlaG